jgi:hypothetical protein
MWPQEDGRYEGSTDMKFARIARRVASIFGEMNYAERRHVELLRSPRG